MRVIVEADVPFHAEMGSGFIDFQLPENLLATLEQGLDFMRDNGCVGITYTFTGRVSAYYLLGDKITALEETIEDGEDHEPHQLSYGRIYLTRDGNLYLSGDIFDFDGNVESRAPLELSKLSEAFKSGGTLMVIVADDNAN